MPSFILHRLCVVVLLGCIASFALPGPAAAKDNPVAYSHKGKTYPVGQLTGKKLEMSLKVMREGGEYTRGVQDYATNWSDCQGDLCSCVGERDCLKMIGSVCEPGTTQCHNLSDGARGYSCLRIPGRDLPNARGEPAEWIYP